MNKEKVSKFSSVLSQLRKERGISQKKAATDLGISQALLSHYEKGIRECGLDFVIRCSEYYGVTSDYLLGMSDSRTGVSINLDDENNHSLGTLANATKQLLDVASTVSSAEDANKFLYDYYLLSLYRGALTLAKAGALPKELFKIDYTIARDLASAAIAVQDAKFVLIEDRSRTGTDGTQHTAIKELIDRAEQQILESFILG